LNDKEASGAKSTQLSATNNRSFDIEIGSSGNGLLSSLLYV